MLNIDHVHQQYCSILICLVLSCNMTREYDSSPPFKHKQGLSMTWMSKTTARCECWFVFAGSLLFHFLGKPTHLYRYHWNPEMHQPKNLQSANSLENEGSAQSIFSPPPGVGMASIRMARAVVWWILVLHTWVYLDPLTRTSFSPPKTFTPSFLGPPPNGSEKSGKCLVQGNYGNFRLVQYFLFQILGGFW